jgi:hypothetical protein
LLDGYCFQYPVQAGFQIYDVRQPGIAAVWGPPLTPTFEPVRAGLNVYKQEPVAGRSLAEIVAAELARHPEAQVVDTGATFAGEPAQIVEGISGMMDSRRYYLTHNDFVYIITLLPLTQPGEYEAAVMAQREQLWQAVSGSFTWLSEEQLARFAGCPRPEAGGPHPTSPYVNPEYDYCLVYPAHYGQWVDITSATTRFIGPALDPTVPEPLRATISISAPAAANERSVQQIVDELVAAYPDQDLIQSAAELGGETAIVINGLPGREAGQDLFAVHNDLIYHLRIEPLGFPEMADDLARSWEVVINSFHFLE